MGTVASIPRYIGDQRRRWQSAAVDRRYATDTGGIIELSQLRVVGEHAEHGVRYQAIQVPVFRRIMRSLRIDHAAYSFVDLGSGKGRALLLAARHPFQRIVGVEFAPDLHEVAVRNVALFRRKETQSPPIELRCQDAVTYAMPETNVVCFLYNPFDGVVMQKVLDNLEASYARHPRRLIVAYRNPRCQDLFDRSGFLTLTHATHSYRIYETRSAA
jgi:SAM-dependent methyltransferase